MDGLGFYNLSITLCSHFEKTNFATLLTYSSETCFYLVGLCSVNGVSN